MARPRRKASPSHRAKPDPLARRVGHRIAELRRERGIRFDAFVGETELGRGYVSELERGLVVPGLHVLDRVAKVLGVSIADLLVDDTPRERLFTATLDLRDADVRRLLEQVDAAVQAGRS